MDWRHVCAVVAAVLSIASCVYGEEPPKSIDIRAIQSGEVKVIGKLGMPLGTIVEVEAKIVSGDSLRTKATAGIYLLDVITVAGKPLPKPELLRFYPSEPPTSASWIAYNHFSLYRLKHGQDAKSLNSDEVAKLERDYVGRTFKFRAYEQGGFSGDPVELPVEYRFLPVASFHFSTELIVLDQRK